MNDLMKSLELETSIIELLFRGSILYVVILLFIRVLPRRTGGELAMMDLIFVLLIAEAAAHAFGEYKSVADGVIMITVLVGWNYLLNYLSYRVPFIERLISPKSIQIIREGQLLYRNMRKEFLTKEELLEHLRAEGVSEIKDVKEAFIEGDGRVSVIRR